ncbi:MAG TPA: GFA family protein [Dongiaceae bacterium]
MRRWALAGGREVHTTITRGHCLCGRVSFEYEGPASWCGHCHCESCRRNTSSPFTTWLGVSTSACRFTGETPKVYLSSSGVRRLFCGHCGTPMAFESARWPDETHFYAASLENPRDFAPQFHVHCAEQLPWIKLDDGLPRHERNAS